MGACGSEEVGRGPGEGEGVGEGWVLDVLGEHPALVAVLNELARALVL